MKRFGLAVTAAIFILTMAACQKEQTQPQDAEPEQPATAAAANANKQELADVRPEFDAVYAADNTALLKSELTLSSQAADECVMLARTGGVIHSTGSSIVKTGDSTTPTSGMGTGLNAAVAALEGGAIELRDSMITSHSGGGAGVFCGGEKATAALYNANISTDGQNSPAATATAGGLVRCVKLAATTIGAGSPGIYSLAGGHADVQGANISTAGQNAPAIYAAGKVSAEGSSFTATGSEGLVLEGSGTFSCTDTNVSGSAISGVFIYRSGLDKGLEGLASMSMTGGSLSSLDGSLIHITNSSARISLQAVSADAGSGIALYASAGRWGEEGRNGGHATLNLRQQTLTGNIVCDSLSTVALNMQNNTVFTGAVNANGQALMMDVSVDDTSLWEVTGDSYVSTFIDEDATLANINDNGNTIYYDNSVTANAWLEGKSYTLKHGGQLVPQ